MSAKYDYKIDMSGATSHSLILKRVTPGSRVLEFGPATGYMTRYLKEELGCTVCCVEIDPDAAALAEAYCDKMVVADLDMMQWSQELPPEPFDHLLFADVIEHLRNPWLVVEEALRFLAPKGTIILSVPNIGHNAVVMDLIQGRFDYRSTGLLDDTHMRFFTRKSLVALFERVGVCAVEFIGTTTPPEDTEFHQHYSDFEEPVQRLLKKRQDAHVYQYVCVCKRKEYVSPDQCRTEPQTKDELFGDGYLQVYWQQNGQFAESFSTIVPLRDSQDIINYEIRMGSGIGGSLRLDPVNSSGCVQIESIELYSELNDTKEELVAYWSVDNNFAGLEPGAGTMRLNSPGMYRLLCTSEDSQVHLRNVPQINEPRTAVLRVSMGVSRELLGVISEEFYLQQNQLNELDQQLDLLGNELVQVKSHLQLKEGELNRIIHSRSWRAAQFLSRINCRLQRCAAPFRAVLNRGYKQVLIPAARLQAVPERGRGVWEATGKDPQFILKGGWPKGWTEISWAAASEKSFGIRLYLDRGRGFNELEKLNLGVVCSASLTKYKVIVPLGVGIKGVRFDPGEDSGFFTLVDVKMAGIGRMGVIQRAAQLHFQKTGFSLINLRRFLVLTSGILRREGVAGLWKWAKTVTSPSDNYEQWVQYSRRNQVSREEAVQQLVGMEYKPTFSLIMPVYNVEERWLRKCIESVIAQWYPYWELCIADDASTDPAVKRVLQEWAAADNRIKVEYRRENGHISAASNSALALATGEYIALLDNDDELAPNALFENALLLNSHPDADMIYSDEDKITEEGKRHEPYFKPDWSPDTFLSQMYTCHLGVYRTKLVSSLGGFRLGTEGSQDYDLVLRLTEKTNRIFHIPKILYHWRTIAQSTAGNPESKRYAFSAGEKVLREALERRGEGGRVEALAKYPGRYLVHYAPKGTPLISIIIPTRDMSEVLGPCLESIFKKTTYSNFEVVIVDNGSTKSETLELFERWRAKEPLRFRVYRLDIPFNYSVLNNRAAAQAKGEILLLLNNDVEVITPNWLEEMAGQALRSSIGVVGATLLYPDRTIQHAGVVLGLGGVAGHGHKGYKEGELGYFGRLLAVSNYAAVTGACMMLERKIFEEAGGLDETLQVAFNDIDFCLKLVQRGYYNVVLPHVKLFHFESKSRGYEDTPEKMQRFIGEVDKMKERWGELLDKDRFYSPNLTLDGEDFALAIRPTD